ncbi:MAG: hypothetical protein JWQ79_3251 [Mucilaginibacter sp.]|jgi:hypothetical protein|nr:hypothetical protein [Mucilaginibacter sp.]
MTSIEWFYFLVFLLFISFTSPACNHKHNAHEHLQPNKVVLKKTTNS